MILFDRLCDVVEKHEKFKVLIPLLKNAELYHFPIIPQHTNIKQLKDHDEIFKQFKLPHMITVVEDVCTCIILSDTFENQMGLYTERYFIDYTSGTHALDNFSNPLAVQENIEYLKKTFSDIDTIVIGKLLYVLSEEYDYQLLGQISSAFMIQNNKITNADFSVIKFPLETLLTNAAVAIEELINIDRTYKMELIENKSEKMNNKILRSNERNYYTIVKH